MIKHIHIFIIVLVTAVFCSHASIIAFDDSSDSVYDSGFAYQNGGSGFDTWMGGDGGLVPANADKYIIQIQGESKGLECGLTMKVILFIRSFI